MIKTLAPMHIQTPDIGGNKTNIYTVELPPDVTFEDLFVPSFWKHATRLSKFSIVRCRAINGEFDICLTVAGKAENDGLIMELWPKFPAAIAAEKIAGVTAAGAAARAVAPTKVPLSKADGLPVARVEYLDATKWRVRGYDGQEVSRDHATEADALKALAKYLTLVNMEVPSDEEIAAAVKAAQEAKAAAVVLQGKKSKAAAG